jgi:hypothetical protein
MHVVSHGVITCHPAPSPSIICISMLPVPVQVPLVLHQIWYQGVDAVPPALAANAARLQALNPDWQYRVWDAAGLRAACAEMGTKVVARWDAFMHMHQRIDFGRYVVLCLHGGLSVDFDVVALRPLTPGLKEAGLLRSQVPVFSHIGGVGDAETFMVTWGRRTRRLVNNAMILTPAGVPGMRELVDALTVPTALEVLISGQGSRLGARHLIMVSTGPERVSDVVDGLAERALVRVISPRLFEPCNGLDTTCVPPGDALLHHRHMRTWMPTNTLDQRLAPTYYRVRGACFAALPHMGWMPVVFVVMMAAAGWVLMATRHAACASLAACVDASAR